MVKNEITAHAIGTLSRYPDVKTILEIGGQDSKIIIIRNGVVVDYAMNTLCAAGTGAFLSSQAKRLGVQIEDLGDIALKSKNPSKIAARCTVFAESDLVHKAQIGHSKEDIVAGICEAVVNNYLNNLAKGKKIEDKVIFQGGVSKYASIVKKATQIKEEDRYSNVYQMELALQGNGNEKLSFADKFLLNLPGFRSNKTSHKVIAIIGYVLYFILLYCAIDVTFINGDVESLINGFVAWSLVPYICFFDVGNVSRFLGKGTQQSKKTILKIIGVALMVIIPNLTLLLDKV